MWKRKARCAVSARPGSSIYPLSFIGEKGKRSDLTKKKGGKKKKKKGKKRRG